MPLTLLQRPGKNDPVVLLVDDDDDYSRLLARVIRDEFHFEVLIAHDGLHAIRILEQRTVDLVVSDENMPGMRGTDLLREVGRRWPKSRRILLSAFTTGDMVVGAGYPVLDKVMPYYVIKDEIRRYARGA